MMIAQHPDEMDGSTAPNLPAGTRRCSGCGTIGYEADKYCPCCGASMLGSCGECGAMIIHPIAYFCTECGATLGRESMK